ncbi:MAG: beta-lactamase family protein [Fimbriimonadaceae bacterium]|nr:beta-lactamase family protein [Fimbriimonadaceae bacterium]
MRALAAWTFLAMSSLSPFAAADAVDDVVRIRMDDRHIQGLSLAVVEKGRLVSARAYGLANVELGARASTDTVYEIGSVSKQFAAVAVMKLVEEGKLDLDKPVRTYLPKAPDKWDRITLRHLLTHTSGLKNLNDIAGFEVTEKLDQAKTIAKLAVPDLEFEPGTKYAYRNTGYSLAGYIVENTVGKPYWTYLRERFWEPIGMRTATTRDLFTVIPNRADGYEWENGKLTNRDSDLTDIFAAGAIAASVLDLAQWVARFKNDSVLKAPSWNVLWTPHKLRSGESTGYGMGFSIGTFADERLIGHGGSTAGFSSTIQWLPDRDLAVIVLTNAGEVGVATRVAREVLTALTGKKPTPKEMES